MNNQPPLIKGSSYDLVNYGSAIYIGGDRYFGQFTQVFRSAHGTHYLLPEEVKIKESES